MIFASDLDQTLIYSPAFVQNRGAAALSSSGYVELEWKDEVVISGTSVEALDHLRVISQRMTFIPVTTRTREQYERIRFAERGVFTRWAVMTNGGTILCDGEIDREWERRIQSLVIANSAAPEELYQLYRPLIPQEKIISERLCDGLFYALVMERSAIMADLLEELTFIAGPKGWVIYQHGRKIYLIPESVNKRAAIAYLHDKLDGPLLAAGDSVLDLPMLLDADKGWIPRHSDELEIQNISTTAPHVSITTGIGLNAAEEIVKGVLNTYEAAIL